MKADNHFIALMNDLQASLAGDEDLTVIAADTFNAKTNSFKEDENKNEKAEVRDNESSGHLLGQELRSVSNDSWTPLKPRPMERSVTPPGDTGTSRGFFCAGAGDVFDTMIPLGSGSASRQPPALPASTPSPAIVEELARAERNGTSSIESTPTRLLPSTSHPSPSALKAGARAWREMHGRPASMGINFRSGMSGHSALMSSSSHPHDYLEPPRPSRSSFRGMSNHTGLTMWKWKSKPSTSQSAGASGLSMLAMPSFFGGAWSHQDEGSTVNSSGSNM
jgi:hypothetical protein